MWLLFLAVAVAVLVIDFVVAKKFAKIAEMKGHDGYAYFYYVFFLGIVGMLMVVALPDNDVEENTARILDILKSNTVEEQNANGTNAEKAKVSEDTATP